MRKIILTIEFDDLKNSINRCDFLNCIESYLEEKRKKSYRTKIKEVRNGIVSSFRHVTLEFEQNRNEEAFQEFEKKLESENENVMKVIL